LNDEISFLAQLFRVVGGRRLEGGQLLAAGGPERLLKARLLLLRLLLRTRRHRL